MLNVGALTEGFVLDHIQAGCSLSIYHDLKLDQLDCCVAIIKNARSNKMGKKDILKVECDIDTLDLDVLGFIDHNITVNVIKDGDIVSKKELMLPKITRSEIRNQADKYYEAGKTAEEIFFRPEVPVARYFSDRCYLLFLDNKEWVAEKVARQWVLENAAYISRQRIWYGCIRNEFMEIKKAAERQKQGKQTD